MRKQKNYFNWCLQMAVIVASLITMIYLFIETLMMPELCFTTFKNDLRIQCNAGNVECIMRYKDVYISKDKYIFNGPLTIRLMAEKYGLDYDDLYYEYSTSGLSAQKFFNKYIARRVKR